MSDAKLPLVSIIIRTKNEERWISSCLYSVFNQTYKNIEVILVDNNSTDRTIKRAEEFPVKIVHIVDFLPGRAINDGIRASKGDIIVCLSGHCVPVNNLWLENLVQDITDSQVAGVYGRQEPLSYSSDLDKRDLLLVFGLDKKIQVKDSFFHNANSAFRRNVWEKFPFDENVTNIEDRVWGQQVIAAGMKIVYEPEARVYHWHGINHDLNPERARKIVRILESLEGFSPPSISYHNPDNLKVIAVIPVRGKSRTIKGTHLLDYTIRAAKSATRIKDVIVASDEQETAALARSLGAKAPFLRPKKLSGEHIDVTDVLKFTLENIEGSEGVPDLVVVLEETYPFRTPMLLDAMINRMISDDLDTLVATKKENRAVWLERQGELRMLEDGFMPRSLKQSNAVIGLMGLACVTRPCFIREGNLTGGRLGVFDVTDPLASMEVRDNATAELAALVLDNWWKKTMNQVIS